jgi:two-component system cell cycle response regulator DivK
MKREIGMGNFDGAHVLIVEDSGISVDVLAGLLDHLNVTYTTVYNSRSVIDVIQQIKHLDAVFLDIEMPGMDGYQVRAALKSNVSMEGIPIIAYSAHSSQMAQAREAGFDGFLGKPLRASEFPAQLAKIFNREPVWALR